MTSSPAPDLPITPRPALRRTPIWLPAVLFVVLVVLLLLVASFWPEKKKA